MSSGQKHRDPWNFPNMKWRARKRLTGRQRLAILRRSQLVTVTITPDTRAFKQALWLQLVMYGDTFWSVPDDPFVSTEAIRQQRLRPYGLLVREILDDPALRLPRRQ